MPLHWRRAWERFTRSPHPFAFAPYCIASRWLQREVVPTPAMPAQVRKEAWPYVLLVASYLGAWLGTLAWRDAGHFDAFAADVLFAATLLITIFVVVYSRRKGTEAF